MLTNSSYTSIHPVLKAFIQVAPKLHNLLGLNYALSVTDLTRTLLHLPGLGGRLTLVEGDLLLDDSVSLTCMREDRLVEKTMRKRLGNDYRGRALPIKDRNGKIIGSVGTIELIKEESVLNNMIIGTTPAMKFAYKQACKCARFDTSILIMGETGTGKELFAELIKEESQRKDYPYIAINCASIPSSLFESEMFGYEKGAFTGAHHGGGKGFFETAGNGTLFLDEIGELELGLQAKLLRVLETGRLTRVGGRKEIKASPRIISATNKDLAGMAQKGEFRPDLFYRLSSIIIDVPPLRERKADILEYIERAFEIEKIKWSKPELMLSERAVELLIEYNYPGNIRELQNILRRAIILADNSVINVEDIASQLEQPDAIPFESRISMLKTNNYQNETRLSNIDMLVGKTLDEIEKAVIEHELCRTHIKAKAARNLGISRDTLYRKMVKYRIGQ